jgi:hypothetical protein
MGDKKSYTRREFVNTLAAVTAGAAIVSSFPSTAHALYSPTSKRRIAMVG